VLTQNPTDWKASAFRAPPGAIIGCDFSGTVVKLGDNLKNADIKLGDKVAGTVHGGLSTTKGSNAQYLRAESDLVFKVPEGVQMEQAATFGVAWVTACQVSVQWMLIPASKRLWPRVRLTLYRF
jgi:NADPH:quinone reductase-like Zn-dependent oxidoreductase